MISPWCRNVGPNKSHCTVFINFQRELFHWITARMTLLSHFMNKQTNHLNLRHSFLERMKKLVALEAPWVPLNRVSHPDRAPLFVLVILLALVRQCHRCKKETNRDKRLSIRQTVYMYRSPLSPLPPAAPRSPVAPVAPCIEKHRNGLVNWRV